MSLENTVRQWLFKDEQLEFILEERYWSGRSCLAITSARAVLFRVGMFRRMRETKDIQWIQLVDACVKEHFSSADLTISFLPNVDCLVYHDSHDPNDPHNPHNHNKEGDELKKWRLSYLRRGEAKEAYRLLKKKEQEGKEKRRKEHLEHDLARGAMYYQTPKGNKTPYTPPTSTNH